MQRLQGRGEGRSAATRRRRWGDPSRDCGHVVSASGPGSDDCVVSFIVNAPANGTDEVETTNGPVHVERHHGLGWGRGPSTVQCGFSTSSGRATAKAINGAGAYRRARGARSNCGRGDGPVEVRLAGNRWSSGSLTAGAADGPVKVEVPRDFRSGVRISSSNLSPWKCEGLRLGQARLGQPLPFKSRSAADQLRSRCRRSMDRRRRGLEPLAPLEAREIDAVSRQCPRCRTRFSPSRDPFAPGLRRHGSGLPRDRHTAQPNHRAEGLRRIASRSGSSVEARRSRILNHPNICHLYDVGPAIVMEYVRGAPVGPTKDTRELLDHAAQIADGSRGPRRWHRPP